MKVSGKEVAEAILKNLEAEIKSRKLKPTLAIILAGDDPTSRIYVNNKIKTAKNIGIKAELFEFSIKDWKKCVQILKRLNLDPKMHGIIIQHPVYDGWNYDQLLNNLSPQKDVDGFRSDSPFNGATALAVWEMLTAFSLIEGFKNTKEFLKGKKIVVLGKGRAAGRPITKLLDKKGIKYESIVKETKNPTPKIKKGGVVISATGAKNVINKSNLKKGSYVIGVGVGKEVIDGKERIYGDIKEEDVSKIAKLYCPTIGGIGPLTIVSLLKNVVESAKGEKPWV